VLEVRIRKSQL